MICIDGKVTSVNIVTFEYHLEDFWLVHGALLHEVQDFVLLSDGMINIVIELDLHFVLELTVLLQWLLLLNRIGEILVVFRDQMKLINVGPRVESIAHWILRPQPEIFSSTQQVHLMQFLVQMLPVHHMRHPGKAIGEVEDRDSELPTHCERIHKEEVPGERHKAVVHAIRVLQVDRRMLNVVARVEKQLTFTVELECL